MFSRLLSLCKPFILRSLFAVPLVLLLLFGHTMSRGEVYLLAVVLVLSLLLFVTFAALPLYRQTLKQMAVARRPTPPSIAPAVDDPFLPFVPRSIYEAHARLSDNDFEYLAAAVIMARDRLSFHARVGGSGDYGVDVWLRNHHELPVAVQAKRYEPGSTVPSHQVRDFSGTLGAENAVYGYFVTTATLTTDGYRGKNRSLITMRLIEGPYLEVLLQSRHREITQCLYEIRKHEERQEGKW